MTARSVAALACVLFTAAVKAQEPLDLDVLIDKLATYLQRYESQLSFVVADENFVQEERRRSGAVARRTTDAEVLFVRVAGEEEWFGIRDVTRVNGTPVVGTGVTLTELLKNPGNDLPAKAAAIAAASARHIIGSRKALVMPTVSLEALSAANHPRYVFKLRGQSRVRGTQTRRLDFTEFDEPTLVQAADGSVLWSRGSVWMEPDTGVVWRAELIVGPDRPGRPHRLDLESKVRVEFALDAALDMMVPRELSEQYWIRGGTGFGKGKYSNFRKLGRNGGTW